MKWYKIAEGPAEKASFLLVDMSYYPAFFEIKKRTKKLESFASFIDCKNNLISEYMLENEKVKKADFGYKFFLNNKNFKNYELDIHKIVSKVDSYKKEIDKIDLDNLSVTDISKFFQKGAPFYHKALGLYLVSQPEYTDKIESFVKNELQKFVPKKQFDDIFITLTLPSFASCLENERREWLKNVAVPAIAKYRNFKQVKNDNKIIKSIERHVRKYKYYPAGVEFGLWDKKHFLKVLRDDFRKSKQCLKKELSDLNNKNKFNTEKKRKIIKQYKINRELSKKIETIAKLGVLRINLRVLGWQFFNYLFPILIKAYAKRLEITESEVSNLTYNNFVDLLKGKLEITRLKKRKNENILILITPQNGYNIFRGKVADKKFNSIAEKVNEEIKEFKGVVANKKGVVRGKVFLFQWGAKDFNKRIYKFPKGAILVAGQTRPLLMPAIRKAKAIITDEGGLLCHAAIVSRELNVPCIIGTKNGTKLVKDNDTVEVNTETGVIKILKKAR